MSLHLSTVMAPTASAFCKLLHTRFHALMRYSNSMSIPIIATVCPQHFSFPQPFLISPNIRFSHIRLSNRFCYITLPRSCLPSLGFYGVVRQQHGFWLFRRWVANLWWEMVELTLIERSRRR